MLIRSAIGFWIFFASSALLSSSAAHNGGAATRIAAMHAAVNINFVFMFFLL